MQNYNVPSAGSDGNYGAPTPHAAAVAHQPYVAPEADLSELDGGFVQGSHEWSATPGDPGDAGSISSGFSEIS